MHYYLFLFMMSFLSHSAFGAAGGAGLSMLDPRDQVRKEILDNFFTDKLANAVLPYLNPRLKYIAAIALEEILYYENMRFRVNHTNLNIFEKRLADLVRAITTTSLYEQAFLLKMEEVEKRDLEDVARIILTLSDPF